MAECPLCAQVLPPGAERCPVCGHDSNAGDPVEGREEADGAYDLSNAIARIPANWQTTAVYTLELPARCPSCREPIRSVRVLRMSRTQVTFTSTLPRGGRAIVCPECERIISVELAAFG